MGANERIKQTGTVGILNVGAGDIKISFDPANPAERIRAARIVKDMLRRGYALLVEVDGKYQRAKDFDEECCCYIVADFDPLAACEHDHQEAFHGTEKIEVKTDSTKAVAAPAAPRKRGRTSLKKLPAESTNAVAVARTAGG